MDRRIGISYKFPGNSGVVPGMTLEEPLDPCDSQSGPSSSSSTAWELQADSDSVGPTPDLFNQNRILTTSPDDPYTY